MNTGVGSHFFLQEIFPIQGLALLLFRSSGVLLNG